MASPSWTVTEVIIEDGAIDWLMPTLALCAFTTGAWLGCVVVAVSDPVLAQFAGVGGASGREKAGMSGGAVSLYKTTPKLAGPRVLAKPPGRLARGWPLLKKYPPPAPWIP